MSDDWQPGDRVAWGSPRGTVRGRVVRKLTAPIDIRGHRVGSSPDHPEFLVESDATGARAAHRPEALREVADETGGRS